MKTNTKMLFALILGIIAFSQSLKAVEFSWNHEDDSNTTKYVLYEQVGEIDPEGEALQNDDDDLPVGECEVGTLKLENVRIKPGASYYVRAENRFFRSGNSNIISIPEMPKGIIELKVTVTLNLN